MDAGDAILDLDGAFGSLAFRAPRAVHRAGSLAEVLPALRAVERAAAEGRWAVGYLAYEAAPAFDPALRVRPAGPGPLAWFAEYAAPADPATFTAGEATLGPLTPDEGPAAHAAEVTRIREGIARGDFYQVNHTFRLRGPFRGDPLALYRRLRGAQGGGLSACLHLGDRAVVSASPELFLKLDGRLVTARPMKGTSRRGRWAEEDAAAAEVLRTSEKDRAENVMIVDLLRNDLGRVAEPGSVRTSRLFDVERYRTVLQLTSTVEARLASGCGLTDLLAAAFPCGSVTGAPKVAAMARIAAGETSPRSCYCGAVGAVAPGGAAVFNVAIRTVEIDLARGEAVAGLGGGITWGSTPAAEWSEALAKGAFLAAPPAPPALVETLRLEGGAYPFLAGHLARLSASARHLGVEVDRAEVEAALARAAATTSGGGDDTAHPGDLLPGWGPDPALPVGPGRSVHPERRAREAGPKSKDERPGNKVRLVVRGPGAVEIERAPLPARASEPLEVALAARPVSRHDPRLFHKTTDRVPYEEARRAHPGVFDVLLWNEEGEATEFTIGNLVAELRGERLTPPRDSGLLAGVYRAALLERGEVIERVIRIEELGEASRLWLVNALRGWVPVVLRQP